MWETDVKQEWLTHPHLLLTPARRRAIQEYLATRDIATTEEIAEYLGIPWSIALARMIGSEARLAGWERYQWRIGGRGRVKGFRRVISVPEPPPMRLWQILDILPWILMILALLIIGGLIRV